MADDDLGLTKKGTPRKRRASIPVSPDSIGRTVYGEEMERHWRQHLAEATSAADAVMRAAQRFHIPIEYDYQARAVAEAALSYADTTVTSRRPARKDEWADEGYRDYLRQDMRHKLLDLVTRQGLIPVALPAETLKYMDRWFNPVTDDMERPEGIPAEAVKQGAEWETVILTLSVPVRRPPVDRAAAVKAGILAGTVTPDGR